MTQLAPTLQAFFTERLLEQRKVSPHTISSYRDSLRLLLRFAQQRTGKPPNRLDFADLDAPLIGAFLAHLDHERGNSPATRNARLAAIHSLFRYAALRHPEHAASIARVLEIPATRHRKTTIAYLDRRRSTRSSPHQTDTPGSGDATTRCCSSRSRPACGSPNSARTPTHRRPKSKPRRTGVSEDLCRHERKRRSCLQPKKEVLSQSVSLVRMAPAASRQASRRRPRGVSGTSGP